jgi:putative DNA methylase
MTVISPKKLIEVALPLDDINVASAREKSIRHGHPSTLHLWWARRPLAAARAVIFAQLVNDPEALWRCKNPNAEPNQQQRGAFTKARNALFDIIRDLVKWENTTNEEVLERAREEIRKSWREVCELNKAHPRAKELFDPAKMPGLHDPFAGGGTIPLEAQRLGLEAHASDLNPVAVLINKAMIEIPPKFAGRPPVNPAAHKTEGYMEREWHGAQGLADDVRYYGAWMREEAQKRIGHLYPPVEITKEMAKDRPDLKPYVGQKLTVIAWLWARTVKSPNPAFAHVDVPLASTFILSSKEDKEAYVQPVIDGDTYRFEVRVGKPPAEAKAGTSAGKRQAFKCLLSQVPMDYDYIREEGKGGRICQKLMAIIAEGVRSRVYLSPTSEHETVVGEAVPTWKPDCEMPKKHRNFQPPVYGMSNLGDLFTPRQLVALTTFSDLVGEARERIRKNALVAGFDKDERLLDADGTGATAYADAVCVYLAFALSKLLDRCCSLVTWFPERDSTYHVFGRQALPMSWDFAETNTLLDGSGSYENAVVWEAEVVEQLGSLPIGRSTQADAQTQEISQSHIISTDPPYYDNIGYADLSDFFYVWLRRSLRVAFPNLFSTVGVPKAEELVATPYRHGGKDAAEAFFLTGMTSAMKRLAAGNHPTVPMTIYYAFKQSETKDNAGTGSTGWETFLGAVLESGLGLNGTWPMRTELSNRLIGMGNNALASSIVLVCRPRDPNAPEVGRRAFLKELNAALPLALDAMTREGEGLASPVAPVDLSQAIIGPGMAIFSKYKAVLEADGTPMTVRTALQLINRFLADDDFDADTQFCLRWFEQHGWEPGQFGEADTLARAKGTAVNGVAAAGVIESGGGSVRLLKWNEYPTDWTPEGDDRLPVWELLHHLIRLQKTASESDAGRVLRACSGKADAARQLAYRLYTLCERAKRADDARAYNEVVTSWSAMEAAAASAPPPSGGTQLTLDDIAEDAQ